MQTAAQPVTKPTYREIAYEILHVNKGVPMHVADIVKQAQTRNLVSDDSDDTQPPKTAFYNTFASKMNVDDRFKRTAANTFGLDAYDPKVYEGKFRRLMKRNKAGNVLKKDKTKETTKETTKERAKTEGVPVVAKFTKLENLANPVSSANPVGRPPDPTRRFRVRIERVKAAIIKDPDLGPKWVQRMSEAFAPTHNLNTTSFEFFITLKKYVDNV